MSDPRLPVGLFDSGIGGLTVFKSVHRRLPAEDLLYLGDNARVPYGTKSHDTIITYACECAAKLVEEGVKYLVVACNTISAIALPCLREKFPDVPVMGVVEPGAQAACRASKSGRIAVIATPSTVRGGAYADAIRRHRPDAEVTSVSCPLFVPLVEEGWFGGPLVEGIAAQYLDPVFARPDKPDCLVLGCSHYPLLSETLRRVIGPEPVIVDSAETTAESLAQALQSAGLANEPGRKGTARFFTTDDARRFSRIGARFLGKDVCSDNVSHVEL